MANPSRSMATMRRVARVDAIEGADRIEAVRIDGWTVVDRKGLWHEGDLVVYLEPDTFCPVSDPKFAFLAERGTKEMSVEGKAVEGHVLRTIRLRGVYSQGLILKPEDALPDTVPAPTYKTLMEKKARLDELVGVWEWHTSEAAMSAGFVGRYDPYVAPRTDAERIQNIDQDTWDLVRSTDYEVSIKVDGTSITMVFDPRYDKVRVFSHNNEFDLTRGMGKLAYDVAKEQGLIGFLESNPGITLQAELCGPKIQSDRLKLKQHRLFVFSVWDMEERHYVKYSEVKQLAGSGAVIDSFVPILSPDEPFVNTGKVLDQFDTPDAFLEVADKGKGAVTKGCLDEGIVVHIFGKGKLTDEQWAALGDELGQTMQVKAVSQKYLSKEK